MPKFTTIIKAVSPIDGEIKVYVGFSIEAETLEDAIAYREENGLGYLHLNGDIEG